MAQYRIEARARSTASPSAVFALLADGSTWPRWGMWDGFAVEEPVPDGRGGEEGVGSLRRLTSRYAGRRTISRERVVALVPGRRLEYALVSGLPLVGYVGRVDLEPDGDGTSIRWTSHFERARVPGTAWLYRRVLAGVIADACTRLARAAESETTTAEGRGSTRLDR